MHRLSVLFMGVLVSTALLTPRMGIAGDVVVEQAWARANVGGAGAAYLTIMNKGRGADRLVSASTPVARKASLHTHLMRDNVMRMRPVEAFEIPPGKTVTLKPGGHHIMLMGLKKRLAKGEKFALTLTFEKAGGITMNVDVLGIAAMGPRGSKGMQGGMKHGKH